jgi:uncharacterized protein
MNQSLGAGIAFPFGVDHRGAIALASGGADIEQAIHLILSTVPGERPMRPDFGCDVHRYAFDTLDNAALGRIEGTIRAALDRWEPRIEVLGVNFDLRRESEGCLEIDVAYAVRNVPGVRNLVYPFYVIPDEGGAEGDAEVVDGEVVEL